MTTPDYRAALQKLLDNYDLEWRARDFVSELLAAPETVGVADDDLRGIFYKHSDSGDDGPPWMESEQFIVAARALLARYGTAHPTPLPVGEKLPGDWQ